MIGLAHVLAFIAGGTIGFILASVVACGRLTRLTSENQSLQKEMERYQRAFEAVAEQNQASTSASQANQTSPLAELNTGTGG